MSERTDELHRWLLEYQEKERRHASMDQMAEAIGANSRSSARYELQQLAARGQAEQVGEPGQARCWRALDKEPRKPEPEPKKKSESAHYPDREADKLTDQVVPLIRVEKDD